MSAYDRKRGGGNEKNRVTHTTEWQQKGQQQGQRWSQRSCNVEPTHVQRGANARATWCQRTCSVLPTLVQRGQQKNNGCRGGKGCRGKKTLSRAEDRRRRQGRGRGCRGARPAKHTAAHTSARGCRGAALQTSSTGTTTIRAVQHPVRTSRCRAICRRHLSVPPSTRTARVRQSTCKARQHTHTMRSRYKMCSQCRTKCSTTGARAAKHTSSHHTHTHVFWLLANKRGEKKRISPALLVQDTRNHQARG
jgi:hypothetical protein